jgi:hypothetical protein
MEKLIEKAYLLINQPIDPNLVVPEEIKEIVNYREAEAGEDVVYFQTEREIDDLYEANGDGDILYHKLTLGTTTPLYFQGQNSKLCTVLIDEILNSKDLTAIANKKLAITRAMDKLEAYNVIQLCLGIGAGQEITKVTGEDELDVIIRMKQLVSNYATNYILLVSSDVADKIETYDKRHVTGDGAFNYNMSIFTVIKNLGIDKVVKIIGKVQLGEAVTGNDETKVIPDGTAILVGRDSTLVEGRPISLIRRKFTKEVAQLSGAGEGAVRLISIIPTPYPINANGKQTLGYSVFGYESLIQVLVNKRAVSFSSNIIA